MHSKPEHAQRTLEEKLQRICHASECDMAMSCNAKQGVEDWTNKGNKLGNHGGCKYVVVDKEGKKRCFAAKGRDGNGRKGCTGLSRTICDSSECDMAMNCQATGDTEDWTKKGKKLGSHGQCRYFKLIHGKKRCYAQDGAGGHRSECTGKPERVHRTLEEKLQRICHASECDMAMSCNAKEGVEDWTNKGNKLGNHGGCKYVVVDKEGKKRCFAKKGRDGNGRKGCTGLSRTICDSSECDMAMNCQATGDTEDWTKKKEKNWAAMDNVAISN